MHGPRRFHAIDPALIIPDDRLSISNGGLKASGWAMEGSTIAAMYMHALAEHYHFSLDTPIRELPPEIVDILLYGTKGEKITVRRRSEYGSGTYQTEFEGIINNLERRFRDTSSSWIKEEIESYMSAVPCDACHGKRLSPESLAVTVGGKNISELCDMSVVDALDFIENLALSERDQVIAEAILKEIRSRLGFLQQRGPRVPDALPRGGDAFRRREPAHPPRDADRLVADGRAVYPRRAEHRPAPARQRTSCSPR